jgi:hypothetical protein
MIRGNINSIAVIGVLLVLACSAHFQQLSIVAVERTVNLAGHYPTEATKIRFTANEDGVSRFSYLLPLEYDSKISIIGFTRSSKDKRILAFTRSIYIYVLFKLFRKELASRIMRWPCPATTRSGRKDKF